MSFDAGFAAALLDPNLAVPSGLVDPSGRPAGKRFDVYRNNVVASLSSALADGFPAVHALVGAEFFSAMAGVYVRVHPPNDPRMMYFGAQMPAFLEGFGPVAHLAYLPDVARLELALRASYHAANAEGLTAERLAALPQDQLEAMHFPLVPSARLIRSPHPVLSIWRRATDVGAPAPVAEAQDVLIARPDFDPAPHALGPGGFAFFTGLSDGLTLAEAAALATAKAPDFDLSAALSLALATQSLQASEHP